MMKKLVLFGAGGMGKETAIMVGYINTKKPTYDLLGYVVDETYYREGAYVNGLPVLGTDKWLIEHKDDVYCCCTVGRPKHRYEIMSRLKAQGVKFETLINPDVYIDPSTTIGDGCVIQAMCMVSTNINIGDGVFLNTDVTIGHDVTLGNYVVCNPRVQISGGCKVEDRVMIGGMSFLNERVKVGLEAVVAPGSVVFRSIRAGKHVIGNPAHVIEL